MSYFDFKSDVEPVTSGDTWYDLAHGGYIDPFQLLEDPDQAVELQNAVNLVIQFLDEAEMAGILEVS